VYKATECVFISLLSVQINRISQCYLPKHFVLCGIIVNSFIFQLDGLEKSFSSFYVCTAVRKFFFFLDPLRTGKVKIQDILACSFLDDLLEVSSFVCVCVCVCVLVMSEKALVQRIIKHTT